MLSKSSVRKPFTVLVAVIITIIFGVVSFNKMTQDLFPKVELPYVAIITAYPGASPQEVEKVVTEPIEQQLSSLENLKRISSTSQKNASIIFLEFEQEAKLDTVSVDIRDKVDLSSGGWNEMVQKPVILKMNPSMIPITVAAVYQKGKDVEELSSTLEYDILRKLEGIEGVASVSATGMLESSIYISIDTEKVKYINKRISDTIDRGLKNAEEQISSQLLLANKSLEELNKAKKKIKDSQENIISQGENLKILISTLKTLNTTKEGLVVINNTIKKSVREQMPGATEAQIEAECMKNPVYARNVQSIKQAEVGISKIVQGLKPFSAQLENIGIDINQLDTLNGVIEAERALNQGIAKADNELSNGMAEVIGNSTLLKAANLQLKASLLEVSMRGEETKKSGNITQYLTVEALSGIIAAQNFEMPAGYISDDNKDILVTVGDKFTSIEDIEDMILLDMGIADLEPVKLADVTNVTYISNKEDRYSKINGEDGIMLIFNKQSDYSTTEVANNIQDKFLDLEKEHDGLQFKTLSDQGEYIKIATKSVLQSLLLGGFLSILILLYFLKDIKPTFITACSIPISLTFAIALMYFSGITLNIVSLAGLAVGIGMLVDNSIVVIENIYRLRAMGYSKVKASISGATQVAGAIVASTLTTICVFAPIIFIEGMTKVILKDMALTVTYSLIASLIVALTVVPAIGSIMLTKVNQNTLLNKESKVVKGYRRIVVKALNHKVIVLSTVVILLVGATGLTLLKGFEYMPSMSTAQISANITMPEEVSKEEMIKITDDMASEIQKIKEVETVGTMLSSSSSNMIGLEVENTDFSKMTFYVLIKNNQVKNSKDISKKIKKIGEKRDCNVEISDSTDMSAMTGGSGIALIVESDNLDDLREGTIMIEAMLRETEGLEDISDIDKNSTEELRLNIDRKKAMEYGLTVAQVYKQITEKMSSEKIATKIYYDGGSRDIVVSGKTKEQLTEQELLDLEIRGSGNAVSDTFILREISEVQREKALNTISRADQRRAQTVTAQIDENDNITKQTNKVKKKVEELNLPKSVDVKFEGEDKEIMEAMKQLMLMFALGILLVYLVMVAQFQSLQLPFIVMFTVPLAITGGLLGLLITGFELSVVSMIGIIMLMGIIVNNAIVLVSYINTIRIEGVEKKEAIIEAGSVRMRPVMMTAITTILGLLPMAIGMGTGSEMMQPVAVVCIGGLLYATLMTLIIIPVMYDIFARKEIKKNSEDELTITKA